MVDVSLAVLLGLIPTAFFMGMFSEMGKDVYSWLKKYRIKARERMFGMFKDNQIE